MRTNGFIPDLVNAKFREFVTDTTPEAVGEGCLGFGVLRRGEEMKWTLVIGACMSYLVEIDMNIESCPYR